MAQQTAVEWLFEKMTEQGTNPYWDMRFIQAKQMEKEQIMESFLDGVYEGSPTDEDYENCKVSGEQYYNKIYNK